MGNTLSTFFHGVAPPTDEHLFGFTHYNVAASLIWLLRGCRDHQLGCVLLCNSCGIIASYESVRIASPTAFKNFLRNISWMREDAWAHWFPIVLLWHYRTALRMRHAIASSAIHLAWGAFYRFDMNIPYDHLRPKLPWGSMRLLWLCALAGHWAPLRLLRHPNKYYIAAYAFWAGAVARSVFSLPPESDTTVVERPSEAWDDIVL